MRVVAEVMLSSAPAESRMRSRADVPVLISLLNSFTGLAAATTGFVLSNDVLIVSGALVGASGRGQGKGA